MPEPPLPDGAREAERRAFLARHGLGGAARAPLAGDASTRRYERLTTAGGASLILMDQPPAVEANPCPPHATPQARRALGYNAMARLAAGRVEAFVAVAAWLRDQGLSAPEVLAADAPAGFAVLEDLGDGLYAALIGTGAADEATLYDAATDTLAALHAATPPAVLPTQGAPWPLLDYDALALETATDLFADWAPALWPAVVMDADARGAWDAAWAPIVARGAAGASVFCHRDYHAENLVWLPARRGAARVGLLDFQDAVRAHPAWDLSMLLHDGRRDVAAERRAAALARYLEARPALDAEAFGADFAALGALNVARILGVFARLTVRDAKPRYAALTPRMWRYLDALLPAPGLEAVAAWFARHAPPSARARA